MTAAIILTVHVAIIAFNLFGLLVIPPGAWRGWRFVRAPLWRLLHVASMAVVAAQAAAGRACFLTLWQDALTRGGGAGQPLIMHWVNGMIFWPLPIRVFGLLYLAAFALTLALLRLVPPRWGDLRA